MGNNPTKAAFNTEGSAADRFREWCLEDLASPDDFAKDWLKKLVEQLKLADKDELIEANRAVCCRDLHVCAKIEWYMYSVYSSAACLVCLLVAGMMWFTWRKVAVGVPRGRVGTTGNFGGATGTTGNFGGATGTNGNFGGATGTNGNFGGATGTNGNFGGATGTTGTGTGTNGPTGTGTRF